MSCNSWYHAKWIGISVLLGVLIGVLLPLTYPANEVVVERNNTIVTEQIVIANVTSTLREICAPNECVCTCEGLSTAGPEGHPYEIHGAWANDSITNGTSWWHNKTQHGTWTGTK